MTFQPIYGLSKNINYSKMRSILLENGIKVDKDSFKLTDLKSAISCALFNHFLMSVWLDEILSTEKGKLIIMAYLYSLEFLYQGI